MRKYYIGDLFIKNSYPILIGSLVKHNIMFPYQFFGLRMFFYPNFKDLEKFWSKHD